jgi:hypothetical protein
VDNPLMEFEDSRRAYFKSDRAGAARKSQCDVISFGDFKSLPGMLLFERHEQTPVDALDFRLGGCDALAGCGVSLGGDVHGKGGDGVSRLLLSNDARGNSQGQQEDQRSAESFHGILLSRVDE